MAGEGERKRKAGLDLDYDSLLGRDDDPPLELMITNAAGKPISPEDAEERDKFSDSNIKKLSDKDLITKSKEWGVFMRGHKLKDGGEKLRIRLEKVEAEIKRRESLKDDNKCKTVITLADEPTRNGPTDVLSRSQAPPSRSDSEFGVIFGSQLDNVRAKKSFEEELSTLKQSDHKIIGQHKPFLAPMTQKNGVSSRQIPFKCPSHLSANNIDNQQRTNREQRGSRLDSNPSFHLSDKDASCCSTKKDFGGHNLRSRNSRRNNRTPFVIVDEEELEDDVVDETDQVGQKYTIYPPPDCPKDARIYYPSRDDPEAIEICYLDLACLAPESYLSSPIMNFYIRYMQEQTSPSASMERGIHIFNTFFYEKLKQDVLNKNEGDDSFSKFRRWWKGVNIFEKAYIFLPIHENHHWSLVIICIPNKEAESGPIILHMDSFRLHSSKSIFSNVKSFLIEEWNFLRKENVLPQPFTEHIWDKLSRRINDKVVEVPQQENGYDCGLFVLSFMEHFIDDAHKHQKNLNLEFGRQWFKPKEASSLRSKIRNLLNKHFAMQTKAPLDP